MENTTVIQTFRVTDSKTDITPIETFDFVAGIFVWRNTLCSIHCGWVGNDITIVKKWSKNGTLLNSFITDYIQCFFFWKDILFCGHRNNPQITGLSYEGLVLWQAEGNEPKSRPYTFGCWRDSLVTAAWNDQIDFWSEEGKCTDTLKLGSIMCLVTDWNGMLCTVSLYSRTIIEIRNCLKDTPDMILVHVSQKGDSGVICLEVVDEYLYAGETMRFKLTQNLQASNRVT